MLILQDGQCMADHFPPLAVIVLDFGTAAGLIMRFSGVRPWAFIAAVANLSISPFGSLVGTLTLGALVVQPALRSSVIRAPRAAVVRASSLFANDRKRLPVLNSSARGPKSRT
jgi:hypothetical protein